MATPNYRKRGTRCYHLKNCQKVNIVKLLWTAALLCSCLGNAVGATITDRTMARPEGNRHYIVVEPAGLPSAKRPVLILLHGHGNTAAVMVGLKSFGGYKTQQWAQLAEREKILLIAPDGTKGSDDKEAWNDCRSDAPTNTRTDDVGFIAALIDTAVTQMHGDPDRVYVFGTSHGGFMAYRLGVELGPKLAGIGVQSALMPAQSACKPPAHRLSVFVTHGTADDIVPYNGGKIGGWLLKGRGTGLGVDASIDVWRKLDGLADQPVVSKFAHLRASDPTSATRYVWGTDPSGTQIEFVRIDGGGHTPSSTSEELSWVVRKLVGEMNHDLTTADEAWNFLKDKRASRAKP
jgi:polyhydroxybutyrate depolymerase